MRCLPLFLVDASTSRGHKEKKIAKAILGILLQEVRGKVGNAVFAKTKLGTIVRPRVQGTNPRTPAQEYVRANVTKASRLYEAFTPQQVEEWDNYALENRRTQPATGKKYSGDGIDAYMELATKFLQIDPSGTPPTAPPTADFTGDSITVSASGGTGKVTFTASGANAAGVTTEFLLQPLKSPNRKPQKGGYRWKGFFAFTGGSLSHEINVPSGYYAAAYRFVKVATGQMSEIVYLPVQTVALSVSAGGRVSQSSAPAKKSSNKGRKAA